MLEFLEKTGILGHKHLGGLRLPSGDKHVSWTVDVGLVLGKQVSSQAVVELDCKLGQVH